MDDLKRRRLIVSWISQYSYYVFIDLLFLLWVFCIKIIATLACCHSKKQGMFLPGEQEWKDRAGDPVPGQTRGV